MSKLTKLIITDIYNDYPSLKFDVDAHEYSLDGKLISRDDLVQKLLTSHGDATVNDCKLALSAFNEAAERQNRLRIRKENAIARKKAEKEKAIAREKAEKEKAAAREKAIKLKIASHDEWCKNLDLDDKGNPLKTAHNIDLMLTESPKYQGRLKYNEFTQMLDIEGEFFNSSDGSRQYDNFIDGIFCDCNDVLGISNNVLIKSTLGRIALDPSRCYHPIKMMIESFVWDGTPRISTLFIDWLKTDDNLYTREVGTKYMISIIKRIFEPGCKVDHLPIITGAQGIGKSTFFQRLGFEKYTTEISASEFDHIDDQLIYKINTSIICTLDELGGMSRKDQNIVKNFFTKTSDKVRLKYGRSLTESPRHCVFAGSTNDEQFLNDYSSDIERRYWTLTSHLKGDDTDKYYIFNNFTNDIVEQLYAEAYYMYCNEPYINCELSPKAWKIFESTQPKYKTISVSPERDFLSEVLNVGYSTDVFPSASVFVQYYQNYDIHRGNYYINRIPMSFIRLIMSKSSLDAGPSKLTKIMESLGFKKYTNKTYNNQRVTLFERNNPLTNVKEAKNFEITDTEPLF